MTYVLQVSETIFVLRFPKTWYGNTEWILGGVLSRILEGRSENSMLGDLQCSQKPCIEGAARLGLLLFMLYFLFERVLGCPRPNGRKQT